MSTHRVIAIVVTYNPRDVAPLLAALAEQRAHTIVVDNGSRNLASIDAACAGAGAELIAVGENLGIAAAQNIGIARAGERGATHVLLMDHDSLPAPDMVRLLLAALEAQPKLAAVGPLAAEEREGADQLVYVPRLFKPGRATPAELAEAATQPSGTLDAAFLIASGCLIRMDALDNIGPMNEALFIDHVDLEWGLRARAAGWRLAAVPAALLTHELGDEAMILPGRAQPVHVHSPIRNYYLARNTIWLIRQPGLAPLLWRARYVWWLAKYVAFNALLAAGAAEATGKTSNQERRAQLKERRRMLARGIRDGLTGRMGRLSNFRCNRLNSTARMHHQCRGNSQ